MATQISNNHYNVIVLFGVGLRWMVRGAEVSDSNQTAWRVRQAAIKLKTAAKEAGQKPARLRFIFMFYDGNIKFQIWR